MDQLSDDVTTIANVLFISFKLNHFRPLRIIIISMFSVNYGSHILFNKNYQDIS